MHTYPYRCAYAYTPVIDDRGVCISASVGVCMHLMGYVCISWGICALVGVCMHLMGYMCISWGICASNGVHAYICIAYVIFASMKFFVFKRDLSNRADILWF
jgi:hypothetical protein